MYGTAVKTVIGASSHRLATHGPAIRCSAHAPNADASCANAAAPSTIGTPNAASSRISNGSPGKKATSSGSR